MQTWKERVEQELDRVVAFWMEHSHDQEHGGFFTCLGRDGKVYDDLKYVWLQGRQVWMYCRLYRKLERFRSPELLDSAKAGGEFLLRYARVAPPGKKCAFVLTRDGRPVKVQRTIFSECFYTMAMNELWRVTGEARYQVCGKKAALRPPDAFLFVCKPPPWAPCAHGVCCQQQSFFWAPMGPELLTAAPSLCCTVRGTSLDSSLESMHRAQRDQSTPAPAKRELSLLPGAPWALRPDLTAREWPAPTNWETHTHTHPAPRQGGTDLHRPPAPNPQPRPGAQSRPLVKWS